MGGYFSIKRNIMSVPTNISVTHEQMVPFVKALLEVFRCVLGGRTPLVQGLCLL